MVERSYGEMDDFDEWYCRLRPAMQRALTAWCGDAALAADALDEAFVRALERWPRVQEMRSPAGWVWRTAANQVRRSATRLHRERRAFESLADVAPRAADGADLDLLRAVSALPDRQRTAVVLHYLADLSGADVAEAMGVAVGTVGATLHQARARLAAELAEPQPIAIRPHPNEVTP